jgi:multidrug resistance efflux pump
MKSKLLRLSIGPIVALGVGLGCYWPFGKQKPSLSLPGTVETQEVRLSSKVGGRVAHVDVSEGDVVHAGQSLVTFDVPELKTQRDQLQARLRAAEADWEKAIKGAREEEKRAAQAAVDAARARLQRLQAGTRAEEVEQARSELQSAEADLKWAEKELKRSNELYPTGAASGTDFDAAKATQLRNQWRVSAARAHLKLLEAGSRPEDIAEAEAEVARLQANYDLLYAGTRPEEIAAAEARVAELKAKLAEIDVNLQEAVVTAPELAVVEVLAVRPGDVVPPNQAVVRVLRTADLWVKVYVSEVDLGKVRLNQEVKVTIDAYPGRTFSGTVMQIASASEFTPRNVQSADERSHEVFAVKVRVANPDGVFKSGMAAEVCVPLSD